MTCRLLADSQTVWFSWCGGWTPPPPGLVYLLAHNALGRGGSLFKRTTAGLLQPNVPVLTLGRDLISHCNKTTLEMCFFKHVSSPGILGRRCWIIRHVMMLDVSWILTSTWCVVAALRSTYVVYPAWVGQSFKITPCLLKHLPSISALQKQSNKGSRGQLLQRVNVSLSFVKFLGPQRKCVY